MNKHEEMKTQILENYIDWFTSNEIERDRMKSGAAYYVDEISDGSGKTVSIELFRTNEDGDTETVENYDIVEFGRAFHQAKRENLGMDFWTYDEETNVTEKLYFN